MRPGVMTNVRPRCGSLERFSKVVHIFVRPIIAAAIAQPPAMRSRLIPVRVMSASGVLSELRPTRHPRAGADFYRK